ncbi:hypothetical protein AR1Y2_0388 [Anaerostipes rhamnosivorans]|uniref:Uncharacterized protein n=1 Tax=Anaerostipes rhamnosivorans TaxID=1229621 RepID=A0A4P8I8L6_9FIRM|nr:hypothetical protein AR1Y2_0388 [Anaerostipes rhamnosivorans]
MNRKKGTFGKIRQGTTKTKLCDVVTETPLFIRYDNNRFIKIMRWNK